jgi:hypothetical protein
MVLTLVVGLCASCTREHPAVFTGPKVSALHITKAPTVDGEPEEEEWIKTASTGAFGSVLDGGLLSPHTELRALWNDDALWLGVYCADQDLRSTDAIHLTLRTPVELVMTVSPTGKLTGAPEGVHAAVDLDGTLDADDGEDDEEWIVELEIPWKAAGLKKPPVSVEVLAWREDTPKGASPRTVSWSRAAEKPAAGLVELKP